MSTRMGGGYGRGRGGTRRKEYGWKSSGKEKRTQPVLGGDDIVGPRGGRERTEIRIEKT